MFGLAEIRRMNQAEADEALRKQFPDHDCTNSLEVDEMIASDYVMRLEYVEAVEDHKGLWDLVQELIERLPDEDVADRFDKQDYRNRAQPYSRGYADIGY